MGADPAEPLASAEAVAEAAARRIAGRPWIIAMEHAAMLGPLADWLREHGATEVLVVASTRGVGDLPDAEVVYTRIERQSTQMRSIRAHSVAIADPSPEVAAAVERFDPTGAARVITSSFDTLTEALGRPVDGARRPEWVAMEDKTIVDALWSEAGVAAAPHAVVDVVDAPAAATGLAGALGSVWAADNTEGWHGGAEYTRWVTNPTEAANAVDWFAPRARRVRVMPFLDGIPCSIHGFVTASGTAAFRPWEMVILRCADPPGFVYGGGASFWDPPADDREEMHRAARAVGERLRNRVGYRGPFSIDGVMTADGFRPTELNPRPSIGFLAQADHLGLPIGAMVRGVVAGDLDVDPDWLETELVRTADEHRVSRTYVAVHGAGDVEADPVGVRFTGGDLVEAPEQPDATLRVGPIQLGVLVIVELDADRIPAGPSVAPLVAACLGFARERWGLPVPDLSPAPDLR